MKIVPVKHHNGGLTYVFSTTENLKEGDVVLCQTKNGTDIGMCISDSFEAEGKALEFILKGCGTTLERMKPVLGVYVYNEFDTKPEKPTGETICGIPADTPIDTPILVWDDIPNKKFKRHFAGFEDGMVVTFALGKTKWSNDGGYCTWEHAESAKDEETI